MSTTGMPGVDCDGDGDGGSDDGSDGDGGGDGDFGGDGDHWEGSGVIHRQGVVTNRLMTVRAGRDTPIARKCASMEKGWGSEKRTEERGSEKAGQKKTAQGEERREESGADNDRWRRARLAPSTEKREGSTWRG